MFTCECSV